MLTASELNDLINRIYSRFLTHPSLFGRSIDANAAFTIIVSFHLQIVQATSGRIKTSLGEQNVVVLRFVLFFKCKAKETRCC